MNNMQTAMITEWDGTTDTVMFEEQGNIVRMIYMDGMQGTMHTVTADHFWNELYATVINPFAN